MNMQKPLIPLIALLAAVTPAVAQALAAQPVHVRDTIVSSSPGSILVNTGSEKEMIAFGQHMRLVGVVNSSLNKVAPPWRLHRNHRCTSDGRFAQGARSPY